MKNIDTLINKLKEAKDSLVKQVNESYGTSPNGSLSMSEKEPHKDDPEHEKKEQEKAKDIKSKAQDILDMHKAEPTEEKPAKKESHMNLVKSQEVFDELVKNGHTESALLLRNWGEEDSLAKSCRVELEKSNKVGRLNLKNDIDRAAGKKKAKPKGEIMSVTEQKAESPESKDLVDLQNEHDSLADDHPKKAKLAMTIKRLSSTAA